MSNLKQRLQRLKQRIDRAGGRRGVIGIVRPDGTCFVNGRRITAGELAELEAIYGPGKVTMVRFRPSKEMEDAFPEGIPGVVAAKDK